MTDDELAGKLEWNAKHGSHAFPPLLYAAAERIYTLSAHVALLKASLAQAEREAEKPDSVAELTAENERLRNLLGDAADEIQNWGAYASEYFQEKHDLAGCVGKYRAAALVGKDAKE